MSARSADMLDEQASDEWAGTSVCLEGDFCACEEGKRDDGVDVGRCSR